MEHILFLNYFSFWNRPRKVTGTIICIMIYQKGYPHVNLLIMIFISIIIFYVTTVYYRGKRISMAEFMVGSNIRLTFSNIQYAFISSAFVLITAVWNAKIRQIDFRGRDEVYHSSSTSLVKFIISPFKILLAKIDVSLLREFDPLFSILFDAFLISILLFRV